MAAKNIELVVASGDVTYTVKTEAIDTALIMKELGALDPEKVPVQVTIAKVDAAGTDTVKANVEKSGAEVVGIPVEFKVTATYNGKTAEVERFDTYVRRDIEISAAQAKKITTAIVSEADGTVRHVPTYVYQSGGKSFARVNSRTNSTYALIFNEQSFSDTAGKWYAEVVSEMASRKIINGTSATTFSGDANITRAEFAAILVRALGLPADGTASFTDVKAGDWYYGAVGTAASYGLVTGYGDGSFKPTASITRQEAMVMIKRAAKVAEFAGVTEGTMGFAGYTDIDELADWAEDSARWNVLSGLIKGSGGELNPTDNITRAESATVILRLLQKAELVDVRTNA